MSCHGNVTTFKNDDVILALSHLERDALEVLNGQQDTRGTIG